MRALDLFAGAGGWSVACQRLGVDEHGVELMPEAVATREAAGFKTAFSDVWAPPDWVFDQPWDGLIASPPCQTFSTAGKGKGREALDDVLALLSGGAWLDLDDLRAASTSLGGDERTALVLSPMYYAFHLNPTWVAFEQVSTVLPVWEACAEELRSWGYSVWTGNLQAEQFGVPRTRKRAFLIANNGKPVAPPVPTHSRYYPRNPAKLDDGVRPWVSMAQALGRDEAEAMGDVHNSHGSVRPAGPPSPTLTSSMDNGNFRRVLRNNNTANAAERGLAQPAPTLYFGKRSNYCAWEETA